MSRSLVVVFFVTCCFLVLLAHGMEPTLQGIRAVLWATAGTDCLPTEMLDLVSNTADRLDSNQTGLDHTRKLARIVELIATYMAASRGFCPAYALAMRTAVWEFTRGIDRPSPLADYQRFCTAELQKSTQPAINYAGTQLRVISAYDNAILRCFRASRLLIAQVQEGDEETVNQLI